MKKNISFCPHCGNKAPQRLLLTQKYLERAWSGSDGKESDPIPWSMFVAACETCNQLLLYENMGDQIDDNQFCNGELVWPHPPSLHPVAVPQQVLAEYNEAVRVKEIAPNAFAVMIGRALEALCNDKGLKSGMLQSKLKKLSEQGTIPPLLADATDVLRILRNIGAHSGSETVHPLMANAIDDFFRAVVEYVYIAPKKLAEFKNRIKSTKK